MKNDSDAMPDRDPTPAPFLAQIAFQTHKQFPQREVKSVGEKKEREREREEGRHVGAGLPNDTDHKATDDESTLA